MGQTGPKGDTRVEFANKLIHFVTNWNIKAREYSINKDDFDTCLKQHKWLFVCPPDWGLLGRAEVF